jgi:ribosome-binding protein aMBF1 (putative translation factor)
VGARPQHSSAYRLLCALLRRWRADADLTQRQLAAKLKKQPSYVHKCEVGDRRIDPVELVLWCRACGVSPTKAMAEIEKQT